MPKKWTLAEIWNGAFENIPLEAVKARPYLHASELGGSFVEVFYKMKGTPYTNSFTGVNRRKMEMGQMMEATVRFVLQRAGILIESQETVDHQITGLLPVHGRLDFRAGGKVNLQQSEDCTGLIKILFEKLAFPKIFLAIADRSLHYVQHLAASGDVLEIYIMEIKSVGDFVYRMLERAVRAMNYHHIQVQHYLLAKKMKTGKVTYLSREDARLMEKVVINNKASYDEYEAWISQMTDYYNSGQQPPLEPLILFNEDTYSFNKNTIGVEWCKYLTKLYGYRTAEDYRNAVLPRVEAWNRVYKRCVGCLNMTADNQRHIADAKKLFPHWDDLVDKGKLKMVMQGEGNQEAFV